MLACAASLTAALAAGKPVCVDMQPTLADGLAVEANAHYEAGQECLRSGDWACYGQEMEALAQILEALVAATQNQP